jgi:hypothetical protein
MHQAHVVHHIPGRVRVKLPHAKGNRALLEHVKQSISPQPGVRQVEVNPATGSVLVHYDPELHEEFHDRLAGHAAGEDLFALKPPELTEADEIAAKIEAEAEFLAEHSEVARGVVNFVKHVNEVVRRGTNNNLDLNVLLPLGLAVYTFFEVSSEVVTPLWVTLGIFSFNSFIALHHPKPATRIETHDVVFDDQARPPASRSAPSKAPAPRKAVKRG